MVLGLGLGCPKPKVQGRQAKTQDQSPKTQTELCKDYMKPDIIIYEKPT